MNTQSRVKALLISAALSGVLTSHNAKAALQGRLPATIGDTDYQAVYDTDLNITWLANTLAVAGSAYDDGSDPNDGRLTWASATAWAASLELGGVSSWRLPITLQPDPTCSIQGTFDRSYGSGCTGSEMGHLFYEEFGGNANPAAIDADPDLALFIGDTRGVYWSSTPDPIPLTPTYWIFDSRDGTQQDGGGVALAWAVHDGDVFAPVPEPETYALMMVGLGLVGFAARRSYRL